MKFMFIAAGLSLLVLPALAQEDIVIDQSRLYVTDPQACGLLEEKGADAFMDGDFLSLSFASGIQGMEYQCGFYDVKGRKMTPLLFVDAICEFPGELYPDTLAIAPNGADSILVVSSAETTLGLANSDASPSDFPVGTTMYYRCDNLSEIPFD